MLTQKLGRSTVQQLLRNLHIGGVNKWDDDDPSLPRPERQNSWESEHENDYMHDRMSHNSTSNVDQLRGGHDSNSADGVALPLVMVGHGAGPYMMGRDGEQEEFGGFQVR